MIEGALLTINVIMAVLFIGVALWSWLKRQDMESCVLFAVIAFTYGLNISYIIP